MAMSDFSDNEERIHSVRVQGGRHTHDDDFDDHAIEVNDRLVLQNDSSAKNLIEEFFKSKVRTVGVIIIFILLIVIVIQKTIVVDDQTSNEEPQDNANQNSLIDNNGNKNNDNTIINADINDDSLSYASLEDSINRLSFDNTQDVFSTDTLLNTYSEKVLLKAVQARNLNVQSSDKSSLVMVLLEYIKSQQQNLNRSEFGDPTTPPLIENPNQNGNFDNEDKNNAAVQPSTSAPTKKAKKKKPTTAAPTTAAPVQEVNNDENANSSEENPVLTEAPPTTAVPTTKKPKKKKVTAAPTTPTIPPTDSSVNVDQTQTDPVTQTQAPEVPQVPSQSQANTQPSQASSEVADDLASKELEKKLNEEVDIAMKEFSLAMSVLVPPVTEEKKNQVFNDAQNSILNGNGRTESFKTAVKAKIKAFLTDFDKKNNAALEASKNNQPNSPDSADPILNGSVAPLSFDDQVKLAVDSYDLTMSFLIFPTDDVYFDMTHEAALGDALSKIGKTKKLIAAVRKEINKHKQLLITKNKEARKKPTLPPLDSSQLVVNNDNNKNNNNNNNNPNNNDASTPVVSSPSDTTPVSSNSNENSPTSSTNNDNNNNNNNNAITPTTTSAVLVDSTGATLSVRESKLLKEVNEAYETYEGQMSFLVLPCDEYTKQDFSKNVLATLLQGRGKRFKQKLMAKVTSYLADFDKRNEQAAIAKKKRAKEVEEALAKAMAQGSQSPDDTAPTDTQSQP